MSTAFGSNATLKKCCYQYFTSTPVPHGLMCPYNRSCGETANQLGKLMQAKYNYLFARLPIIQISSLTISAHSCSTSSTCTHRGVVQSQKQARAEDSPKANSSTERTAHRHTSRRQPGLELRL